MIRCLFYTIISVLFFACNQPEKIRSTELRGVWLTNVDSKVMDSRENIAEAMRFLAENNFNMVCPVVWNKGMTLYRSAVMDSMFHIPIDTLQQSHDPLAEVIEEAHKYNIAVIAWFEFGFSSSYKENGGHLLKAKPHWAARDSSGKLLTKNGFEWMNAYHPEVQQFMLDLVSEVVKNYKVDGVQGDDRLPAQPSEGGYSDYTRELYAAEHQGQEPPQYSKDPDWLRWRAEKLNTFAGKMYDTVKSIDKDVLVTWSPSIHPWAYEQYLQDWPAWIKEKHADLVFPQHYRYTLDRYQTLFDSQRPAHVGLTEDVNIIYPGILMKVSDYLIEPDYLVQALKYNREHGVNGEVFFFYEGLRKNNDQLARLLKDTYYKKPAKLPVKTKYTQQ
ncbi:MAG: family 10 glycosylhydrolase [Calditrichae bacterium]|nr:family 10 glycosylhydrolase [Calditrichia bacterium]